MVAYREAAEAYVEGVRAVFAGSGIESGTRGARGPTSPEDLAAQAHQLAARSDELTQAAVDRYTDPSSEVRVATSAALLAKALTDLRVSERLLHAAEAEERGQTWATTDTERRAAGSLAPEEYLKIVLDPVEATTESEADRRGRLPATPDIARTRLTTTIGDTLALVTKQAGEAGGTALGGVVGLVAPGLLGDALGFVSVGIGDALGQADKLSYLYELFRTFVAKAWDSVIALLGEELVKAVVEKVQEWIQEWTGQAIVERLLEGLYQTEQTAAQLEPLVTDPAATLEKLVRAIDGVSALTKSFGEQIRLAERLLSVLKRFGNIASGALPYGQAIVGALYVVLSGYIVLTGADYVDAERLTLLQRVSGVRDVVVQELKAVGS